MPRKIVDLVGYFLIFVVHLFVFSKIFKTTMPLGGHEIILFELCISRMASENHSIFISCIHLVVLYLDNPVTYHRRMPYYAE